MRYRIFATIIVGAAFLLGLMLAPRLAHADTYSALEMLAIMNGTPVRVGTLTSTGTSASVTVTAGTPYLVICDGTTHVGVQATCHATITNANYCVKQSADERVYIIPRTATLSAISASGTTNCSYFTMQ